LKSLWQINDNTAHSLLLEAPQLPFRIIANDKVAQSDAQRTFRSSLCNRDRIAAPLHALSPVLCFVFVVEGNLNHESFQWFEGAHRWLVFDNHISRLPQQSELLRGLLDVLVERVTAVDGASIFIREGDRLQVTLEVMATGDNKIVWHPVPEPMPQPLELAPSQVLEASRAQNVQIHLKGGPAQQVQKSDP